jgi:hypothetical protein
VKYKEGFTMVRSNLKKFMAFATATCMIIGCSVTSFATAVEDTSGVGEYEGNDVTFAAATRLTVPTAPETGFKYIGDPNGLIRESSSSHYDKATWSDTAKGIFFKTSGDATNGYTYSENSAALEVVNNNASPIIVSAKIKQQAAGTNVVFTDDATFAGTTAGTLSTDKSIYIAITDGTNTKAIKAGGAEVELPISVVGKVANYELKYVGTTDTDHQTVGYYYELKDGIATTDKDKWNKTSFYVTGALNENANWTSTTDAAIAFPSLTVTWDVKAGAVPLKVKSGKTSEVSLTHSTTAANAIKSIKVGDVEISADVVSRTDAAANGVGKVSLTAAQATALYDALLPFDDGLVLDVEYADGYVESVVIFAR